MVCPFGVGTMPGPGASVDPPAKGGSRVVAPGPGASVDSPALGGTRVVAPGAGVMLGRGVGDA